MQKFRKFAFGNKKRKAVAGTLAMLLIAGTAVAYFLLQATGSTTATGNLGNGGTQAVTMTSNIASGLTPGSSVTVTVSATNPNPNHNVSVPSVTAGTITTPNAPVCASYLSLGPNTDTLPATLAGANSSPNNTAEVGNFQLSMSDNGNDQGECQNTAVSIPFTIP